MPWFRKESKQPPSNQEQWKTKPSREDVVLNSVRAIGAVDRNILFHHIMQHNLNPPFDDNEIMTILTKLWVVDKKISVDKKGRFTANY